MRFSGERAFQAERKKQVQAWDRGTLGISKQQKVAEAVTAKKKGGGEKEQKKKKKEKGGGKGETKKKKERGGGGGGGPCTDWNKKRGIVGFDTEK